MKAPPPPAAYYATIADVLVGAAILWATVTLCRRYAAAHFRWVQIAFLVSLILPLNALRAVLSVQFTYLRSPLFEIVGTRGVAVIGVLLAAAAIVLIVRYSGSAARFAAGALAFFVPLVPVTFAQAIWKAAHYDESAYHAKLASPIPQARTFPRVLWVICDEWDYSLTFEDRSPSLALPQIDRLRQETLFASNAHPPGPETPISIPGYVTGKLVKDVAYIAPHHLEMHYRDSNRPVFLDQQPTIFSEVRAMGLNSAVVGWFHPYCGLFHNDLVSCDWWELTMQHNSMGRTFWGAFLGEPRSIVETTLFSPFGQSLSLEKHIETYHAMMAAAEEIAADKQYQLAYVHLPIPHAPFGYNRVTGRFDLSNSPLKGYIDNLALLDRSLGELRQCLEGAHLWNETTVVITTDHPYRQSGLLHGKWDPRIPFFLKVAGQRQGIAYTAPFNTVLVHDLLLAVLRQEVTDGAGAEHWLDAHRSSEPLD